MFDSIPAGTARDQLSLKIAEVKVRLQRYYHWPRTTAYWVYHLPVHALAERLLATIRNGDLLKPGDRVAVAVSGGADSVALLLLLLELREELGIVLTVAHINHKLRGNESDADERFVADLAKTHAVDLYSTLAPLTPGASGIEAAARELRYEFFRRIAREHRIAKVATAHTLDDQAETVLLRIMRGTGVRGLSGIHPRLTLSDSEKHGLAEVVRPLLSFRRDELRKFLNLGNRIWREDSSNLDPGFLRNRVRHEVLPFLSTISRSVAENLSDLAEIARVEEEHWQIAHPEVRSPGATIDLNLLSSLPLASRRRFLLKWLADQAPQSGVSLHLTKEILELTQSEPGRVLELSSGYRILRTRQNLSIECPTSSLPNDSYQYSLPIPGTVTIAELKLQIEAVLVDPTAVSESEQDSLLDLARAPSTVTVRNWRPGDRFWPAHTKEPKKVKDLLNDRHITGPEKKLWPVLSAGDDLLWVRTFPVPAALRPAPDAVQAVLVRPTPL